MYSDTKQKVINRPVSFMDENGELDGDLAPRKIRHKRNNNDMLPS